MEMNGVNSYDMHQSPKSLLGVSGQQKHCQLRMKGTETKEDKKIKAGHQPPKASRQEIGWWNYKKVLSGIKEGKMTVKAKSQAQRIIRGLDSR